MRIRKGVACLLCVVALGSWSTVQAAGAPLTRVIDVRSLSVEEARMEKPVQITGVVILVQRSAILFQDETGGTFFRPSEEQMFLQVGDKIEVQGKTEMGLYIAGVGPAEVRLMERGTTPEAITAGFDDIVEARYFYQQVAVEGIVRSLELNSDWTRLRLAMGARILEVRVDRLPSPGLDLVDAKVRISGLSAGSINDQRHVVETFVRIQSWDAVHVMEPPQDLDSIPVISASELLAFSPAGRNDRRIRVMGTVTAIFPDGEIYLQEGQTAFAARLVHSPELGVGDQVELMGFSEVFQFAASVVDAEVLTRMAGSAPVPVKLDSPDVLDVGHDTRLVAITARVADAFESPDGYSLVLAGRHRTVQAFVTGGNDPPPPGSRVQVSGICHVEVAPSLDFLRTAGAMYLQSRSSADVVLLESPPWWTPRRLLAFLGAFAGVILVAVVWNVLLHRQVRRQTAALCERIESEAALEERNRIAQDFHDTLEQDLTGLGLRLDAAATRAFDDSGRSILAVSRSLLARIQAETKNIVSNLRETNPKRDDFVEILEDIVKNSGGLEDVRVTLRTKDSPPRLPAGALHHLHLMVRESVNNAIKHAHADEITVETVSENNNFVLRIRDNGCGFDSTAMTHGMSGHFGCVGIRERARKIGATVSWRSSSGEGTEVEIFLRDLVAGADSVRT